MRLHGRQEQKVEIAKKNFISIVLGNIWILFLQKFEENYLKLLKSGKKKTMMSSML